jgi:hypothetical protein
MQGCISFAMIGAIVRGNLDVFCSRDRDRSDGHRDKREIA